MNSQPRFLSDSSQIRRSDRIMIEEQDFPGILLMERAGQAAAEHILACFPEKQKVLILAGPGNNGGDGLVIARRLSLEGMNVHLQLSHAPEQYQGDAEINWKALKGAKLQIHQWPCESPAEIHAQPSEWLLIDALLGTGIQSSLRGPVAEIIAAFKDSHLDCVAIDLPSGLSADTGEIINSTIPAQQTLTFQLPKICHHVWPAAELCGEVELLEIGIWPAVIENLGIKRFVLDEALAGNLLRDRAKAGHKGSFGHALFVGGSKEYAGAIALSAKAALQAGAGLSSLFTVEAARCAVYPEGPELMVKSSGGPDQEWLQKSDLPQLLPMLEGKQALGFGPGLGNEAETTDFVKGLLQAWARPLVIDADGLNQLASEPELWRYVPQGSILTPHLGEMRRLLPGFDVLNKRLEAAERLSHQKQVIVVLKGAGTIIALPDGRTFVNTSGNSGMGTAGAGDVLTGTITGLMAQGHTPEEATLLGVHLHGLAGDLAAIELGHESAVTASAIAANLGRAHLILEEEAGR